MVNVVVPPDVYARCRQAIHSAFVIVEGVVQKEIEGLEVGNLEAFHFPQADRAEMGLHPGGGDVFGDEPVADPGFRQQVTRPGGIGLDLFTQPAHMYIHGAAPGFVMTKKPIKTTADIKGLRIKANAENVDIVKNLGGAPVTMPVGETYDALSRGIVDGTLFPVEALQGFKIGEVVKTVLEDYGMSYMTSMYVVMNKAKWDSISPADQKAIEQINEEYNEKIAKRWVELDNAAKEYAKGKGVTFVTVSEKEQAVTAEKMKPIWDAYVEMTKSKGLPGDEALKFCLDFLKTNP